jgi:hypothetical protein
VHTYFAVCSVVRSIKWKVVESSDGRTKSHQRDYAGCGDASSSRVTVRTSKRELQDWLLRSLLVIAQSVSCSLNVLCNTTANKVGLKKKCNFCF